MFTVTWITFLCDYVSRYQSRRFRQDYVNVGQVNRGLVQEAGCVGQPDWLMCLCYGGSFASGVYQLTMLPFPGTP